MKILSKISEVTDRKTVRLALMVLSLVLLGIASYFALVYAPSAQGEPETYRILYFHVPSAIMTYFGFFICFVGSILFLMNKDLKFDKWAVAGAEVGVLFTALMIGSGMIWGKQRWGAWWIWEPRLTTAFVLLIIFVGYLILRSAVEGDVTRARYCAIYGIVGFVNVPIVHFAIKIWGNVIHPVVIKSARNTGMTPEMYTALRVSFIAFFVTFVTLYILRLKKEQRKAQLSRLRGS